MSLIHWQINWFFCVGLVYLGYPNLSLLAVAPLIIWNAWRCSYTKRLLLPSLLCGFILETIFHNFGWIEWTVGLSIQGCPPLFLLALWLNMALAWKPFLDKFSPLILYPIFIVGTAPAYYGGSKLGCLRVVETAEAYIGIGLGYALTLAVMRAILKFRGES